ncbi:MULTISPECIES: TetR/AcrR family transcriptional regulator [Nocardia]|uniref:TetR/AcrR family transcriptional regulator n=1 Tax=Nocardia TaxID=1817 RepID=UPI001C4F48F5|nr:MULTISPECIES: TetR/AcrR family transcriptional regulator C-terminal domain-containing protein [Nocardia]
MPTPSSQPARTGRPARLTRGDIVAAAHAVIETDGVEKLTMRRLAGALECTPMALYHHVRDKDELLRLLLDDYADGITWPALPDDPRQRILVAATAMYDALAAHAWIVEVLVNGDLFGRSALWVPETIIDAAIAAGLNIDRAVAAYRAIWHYTAGDLIVTGRSARRAAQGPTYRAEVFANLDPDAMPRLAEVGSRWTEFDAVSTYATGLDALVTGLLAEADRD